jgi:DNA replication and repair protein RecF
MLLKRLATENFRNLVADPVEFHPQANIVVGRNGQGKTNLLEAIYFLATTKSFRTTRVGSVFRHDMPSVFVSGVLHRDGLDRTLSVGLETGEAKKRVLMINGEKVTLPAYLHALSVFAYSSARLDAIRGTPEDRRRFLDRGIASVQPAYVEQLSRYTRVLKQRNALLAEIAQQKQAVATLDAWDNELMVAAAAVHRTRAAYVVDLADVFREVVAKHGYHVTNVELRYKPSLTEDLARIRRHELRARSRSSKGLEAVRKRPGMYIGSTGAARPAPPRLRGRRQLDRRGAGRLLRSGQRHDPHRQLGHRRRQRPRHPGRPHTRAASRPPRSC